MISRPAETPNEISGWPQSSQYRNGILGPLVPPPAFTLVLIFMAMTFQREENCLLMSFTDEVQGCDSAGIYFLEILLGDPRGGRKPEQDVCVEPTR